MHLELDFIPLFSKHLFSNSSHALLGISLFRAWRKIFKQYFVGVFKVFMNKKSRLNPLVPILLPTRNPSRHQEDLPGAFLKAKEGPSFRNYFLVQIGTISELTQQST